MVEGFEFVVMVWVLFVEFDLVNWIVVEGS